MPNEKVKLFRVRSNDEGTIGIILFKNHWKFVLELPWQDNAVSKSRIKSGEYKVVWTWSNKFQRHMYLILDTPGRTGIRIHAGNWAGKKGTGLRSDSFGCPLLGETFSEDGHQLRLWDSRKAMKFFEDTMNRESFVLRIFDPPEGE